MTDRKLRKKVAAYHGKADYDYFDDVVDNLLIPSVVSAITAFIVTILLV